MTDVDTDAVRQYLCSEHAAIVEAVQTCAEASAATGTTEGRSDTSAVRRGTEACLRESGIWNHLPSVLAGCVEQTGKDLRASPVAAAPYVTATATGVVLRATLDTGRLVVAIDALGIERSGDGPVLQPRGEHEEVVRVEWRQ